MSATHDHDTKNASRRRLAIVLALVVLYMGAEIVGGLIANSLALLADAGHMLSDAASLGLALFAISIARRPRSPSKTFGYHRAEILAALVNGATLVAVAVYVVAEAWSRFRSPEPVDGSTMIWIASGGLVVNLVALWVLRGGGTASLNVQGAWLHVIADTLGSVQAIVAAVLIRAFGWNIADPIAGMAIAALVVWSAWALLRKSVNVLMEGTPEHIDADEVKRALAAVGGVVDVHDLHVWSITSGFESLSVHARIDAEDPSRVLEDMRRIARERFDIRHSTIQLEDQDDECEDGPCRE